MEPLECREMLSVNPLLPLGGEIGNPNADDFVVVMPASNNGIADSQTITLNSDGSFVAELAHEKREGTYTEKTANNGTITVNFVEGEISVSGRIINGVLTIPKEWQDEHGHGTFLKLK